MILQSVNKDDTERIWIWATNTDGQTITAHYPVFKHLASGNASSVSVNEYGSRQAVISGDDATAVGNLVGVAYQDIAHGASGPVQVYGYHESILVMRVAASVTVIPGHPLGVRGDTANSIGFSSAGVVNGYYGPVVALDTIGAVLHSLGTVGQNFADHVLLKCL